ISIAFLEKPSENDGFKKIVDFLNANQIKYALTVSPIIYTSCIKKFWTTVKIKTVNDDVQLQALIDEKKVVINEASIRHDLKLNDAEGTSCLTNAVIFEELARMVYEKPSEKLTFYKSFFSPQWKFFIHTILQCISAKTTSWNEFSSTMASVIICLANNQKFNFTKYILNNLKKNLEAGVPFYMFPRMKLKELMDLCTNLSNKVLDLENEVIEMKSSHKAKIVELESMVEKLEEENRRNHPNRGGKLLILMLMQRLTWRMYTIWTWLIKTVLSMQDVTDADVKEVAEEMVEVITTAKIIVDEVSTIGGQLNAANEEPVSAAPTNITTAQPSEATKTTVDITTAPKAKRIVFHDKEESTTRTEAKELKKNLEIVPVDEDDVFVNVTPLSSKPPTIMDYKIYKEGKKEHFQIIRANGNHRMYLAFSTMLKNFNREDLEVLWMIVKDRFKESQPKEVLDVFLWHTLKVMFEHIVEDNV
nr:hypothetical protein [Tanacetum cinerariifolium]